MKKKCKVVMLATDEKSCITMSLMNILIMESSHPENNQYKNQHLYIVSDDVKEGDYFKVNNVIHKCIGLNKVSGDIESNNGLCYDITKCKKVIATTDSLLVSNSTPFKNFQTGGWKKQYLPQTPQHFIEHFVSEYNKGNVITEVMVEYEEKLIPNDANGGMGYPEEYISTLKINQDNTINIDVVKNSYSKEEVHNLIMQAWITGEANVGKHYSVREKWIEENL